MRKNIRQVFITKFKDEDEIRQKLLEAFIWIKWQNIIDKEAKVFIKPNLTWSSYRPGVTTSPEIIEAVISILKNRTSNIIIGESDGEYHSFEDEEIPLGREVLGKGILYWHLWT